MRIVLSGIALLLATSLGAGMTGNAYALTQNQPESHNISGQDLSSNPMVAKILSEIEYSKKQIAQIQKNQKDQQLNDKLVAEQRLIVKKLEDQAYQIMLTEKNDTSPQNAYTKFVSGIPNDNTKQIFLGQFSFTMKRVDAGHEAMKKVLDNGGTYEEALAEFSKYAAIRHVELIQVNQDLNIKYNMADANIQENFDKNGMLPDDYIKIPSVVTSHSRT